MVRIMMIIVFWGISRACPHSPVCQAIEKNLIGLAPNSFTLAAVRKLDGNVAGYVHCSRKSTSSLASS